jgi:hypothetical protein
MYATTRAALTKPQGRMGLLLLAICWPLNWTLPGTRTAYLFFPLWLGYILTMDALVQARTGTSLWSRSRSDFWKLFLVSAPVWWVFEAINWRTQNWEYLGADRFTRLEYYLLCTLCFSTVMPAIFETAELMRSFRWTNRFASRSRVVPTARLCTALFLSGLAMLALLMIWPRHFYPFVWISLALILEPVNRWLRRGNFLDRLQTGDWAPVVALSVGALICGFFWELWNYWSYPKWIYHTPGAEILRVFEMPLPGYGGYIPFALELYLLKHFLWPRGPKLRL